MLERRLSVSQLVRAHDEVLCRCRVVFPARSYSQWNDGCPETVHEQDGVVFGGIQLSVSELGDLEIGNDAAPFEAKLAEIPTWCNA